MGVHREKREARSKKTAARTRSVTREEGEERGETREEKRERREEGGGRRDPISNGYSPASELVTNFCDPIFYFYPTTYR